MLVLLMRAVAVVILLTGGARAALAAEPILLSRPDTVSNADRALVLVHGLLGSAQQSFADWPTIIGEDQSGLPGHGKVSDFAIYAVDYESDFTSSSSLEDIAVGVANDLAGSAIFKRHRHVWFVAHSMGGLVLKRVFSLWDLQGKGLLIDRVMGVAMLGVPSAGAPLADLANTFNAGTVASWLGWNGELVQDLTTESGKRYLDSLENNWMALRVRRQQGLQRRLTPIVSCGYETKAESWFLDRLGPNYGSIVPKLFTASSCDERRGFPVVHTKLPKPKAASDSVHIWLKELIERSIVAGAQEQRLALSTGPLDPASSSLASRVHFMNRDLEINNLDRATSLPLQPEEIRFADDLSKEYAMRLVLRGGPFYGATKADLLMEVAKVNSCLLVDLSPNRLVITLGIQDELLECSARGAFVCVGQTCE